MRLVYFSIVIASVALLWATVLYLKVERLERDLGSPRAAPREGLRVSEAAAGEREEGFVDLERGAVGDRVLQGGDAPARAQNGRDVKPISLEERIERLERDQKTLRAGHAMPLRFSERFARSTEDLARQLSLTTTQRTRIEEAIGRARQRIEDVLKIPDETGKSPFERRVEARKKLEEAMKNPQPGGVLAFATDMVSYRDRKIPGRNDTYADEIDRIRKETREEISTALDPKQQEAFQQTNVDGLLGEAGQVSFAYDGSGGMAFGMETSLVVEHEAVASEGEETAPEAPGGGGR